MEKIFFHVLIIVMTGGVSAFEPLGTAFVYQGRLHEAGDPAEGIYDFRFMLYDDPDDPILTHGPVYAEDVEVTNGYFQRQLDFGDYIFTGLKYFLQISVRPGVDTGAYTTLSPMQEITPSPYSFYSKNTDTLDNMDSSSFAPVSHTHNIKQLIDEFEVAPFETISKGDVVSILDGYVYRGLVTGNNTAFTKKYVFNYNETRETSIAVLSWNKFVLAYQSTSGTYGGFAMVGEFDGDSITFGSPVLFSSSSYAMEISALSSTKIVITYRGAINGYGTAIIGEVSGNTISFGSEYPFNYANTTDYISNDTLSENKFVVVYWDPGNSKYGTAIIGNVSGNVISFGSEYVFNTATTTYVSVSALSDSKFVAFYTDQGNSNYGTSIIGDVSGSSISFGSEQVFNAATTTDIDSTALTSERFVTIYRDFSGGSTAIIGDVSGSSITFGAESCFYPSIGWHHCIDSFSANKVAIAYYEYYNDRGAVVIGNISGDTMTFGNTGIFNAADSPYPSIGILSDSFVISFKDEGNSDYGSVVLGNALSSCIGIAKYNRYSGQSLDVIIGGISDVHTDLIPGYVYYSSNSGSLTTNITDYRIGFAISDTELLINSDRDNLNQYFGDMIFLNNFRITEGCSFEGLIFKNQLGRDILAITEQGSLNIKDTLSITPRTNAPENPKEGDMYMDSTDHKLKVYDGKKWQPCW